MLQFTSLGALIQVGLQMFTAMNIGCQDELSVFPHFCSKTNRSRISFSECESLDEITVMPGHGYGLIGSMP